MTLPRDLPEYVTITAGLQSLSATGGVVSEANKTAMRQFFERVYNQGDVAFLDELTLPTSSAMTEATRPAIARA